MKIGSIKTMANFKNATMMADGFRNLNISIFENFGKLFKGTQYFETARKLFAEKGAGGGLIVQRNDKGAGFSISSSAVLSYLPIVFRGIVSLEERRKCTINGAEKEYLNLRVSIDDPEAAYQKTVSLFVDLLTESLITCLLSEPKYNVLSWLENVIRKNYFSPDEEASFGEKERERLRTNQFEADYSHDAIQTLKKLFSKAIKGSLLRMKGEMDKSAMEEELEKKESYFDSCFLTLWPNQMRVMVASEMNKGEWEPASFSEEVSLIGVKCCFVNIFKKITIAKDGCIYISPSTVQVWPLASSLKLNSEGKLIVSEDVLLKRRELRDVGVFIKVADVKKQVADLSFMEDDDVDSGKKKRKREPSEEEPKRERGKKRSKVEYDPTQVVDVDSSASSIILPDPPAIVRHKQAVSSGWIKREKPFVRDVESELPSIDPSQKIYFNKSEAMAGVVEINSDDERFGVQI